MKEIQKKNKISILANNDEPQKHTLHFSIPLKIFSIGKLLLIYTFAIFA